MTEFEQQSYEELLAAQKKIEAALASKKDQAIKDGKEQIQQIADRLGIKVSFDEKKPKSAGKRRSPEVRYRDPANPENTWTGQGKPKRWLQKYIDEGRSRDEFLIK